MHSLVRTVFGKLRTLNVEEEERKLKIVEEELAENEMKMSVNTQSTQPPVVQGDVLEVEPTSEPSDQPEPPSSVLPHHECKQVTA